MNKAMKKDFDFLAKIVAMICDYAVENNMNPTDTVKTVAADISAIASISNFDSWKKEESE